MPKVPITRSRTCQATTYALLKSTDEPLLREVTRQKPLPADSSASINKKMKTKNPKRKPGERLGGIGGSSLSSQTSEDRSTRSFGQTCQPKKSNQSTNIVRCRRCDGWDHEEMTCTAASTLPQLLFCKDCKMTSKNYRDNDRVVIELQTCKAHSETVQKAPPSNPETVAKAKFFLDKVRGLTDAGMPLPDAIRLLGLTETDFNSFKVLVQ